LPNRGSSTIGPNDCAYLGPRFIERTPGPTAPLEFWRSSCRAVSGTAWSCRLAPFSVTNVLSYDRSTGQFGLGDDVHHFVRRVFPGSRCHPHGYESEWHRNWLASGCDYQLE